MRRRVILISLVAIAVLGFYTGRTVLPGVYGYGTSPAATAPSASPTEAAIEPAAGPAPSVPALSGTQAQSSNDPQAPQGPAADLWVDVDISDQVVRVMRGDESLRMMTASTGVEGHETPLGTFEIQNRGEWFFNEKYGQGAKYWVSFKDWGVYLFHSLAMDRDQKVIPEEEANLGTPASHGCVRLTIEDAKWIYNNVPQKARVVIHD